MQRGAQTIQNIAAISLALPVVQGMQCWICNFGLLLKLIAAPAFPFKNLLQCADDHNIIVRQRSGIVNSCFILKVLFTYLAA
jgi:hypothetical protein